MCFFKLPYSIKKQLATTHASRRKKPHSTIRLAHHLSRSHLRTRSTGTCHRFFLAAHLTEKLKKYHVSCMQSFFILNWVVGFNGTNHFHLACTILHQRKILYPDRRLFPCAHYEILIHFKAAIVLMHFLCTAHLWLLSSWYVSRQQSRLCTFMYHTPVTPFIMVSWYVQVSNHVCALFCTTHLWLLLSWYVSRQQSWLCTFVYHTPVTPLLTDALSMTQAMDSAPCFALLGASGPPILVLQSSFCERQQLYAVFLLAHLDLCSTCRSDSKWVSSCKAFHSFFVLCNAQTDLQAYWLVCCVWHFRSLIGIG